jgi:hypothetical protein
MRAELGAGSSSEKACDIGRAFAITLDEAREGSQVAASTLSAAYSFGDFGLPKDEVAAACWDRLTRPGATAECAAPRLEALDEGACRGSGKQGNASFSED